MFNFGKTRVRSINSFGIAGILGENVEVFHTALFTTKHIGRLSDLLFARLKRSGINEVRFRTLMIFGIFQAYRGQMTKRLGSRLFPAVDADVLETPMLLECGLDDEKLALGLSFSLSKNIHLSTEGLAERVLKKEPRDQFEQLIIDLDQHVDRMILKYQSDSRKVEIISVLGIEGKIDRMSTEVKHPIEVVALEMTDIQDAPRAKKYTELGDLNYRHMLRDIHSRALRRASATGEFLMPSDILDNPEEVPYSTERVRESRMADFFKIFKSKKKDLQNQQVTVVRGAETQVGEEIVEVDSDASEEDEDITVEAGEGTSEPEGEGEVGASTDGENTEDESVGLFPRVMGGTKKLLKALYKLFIRGLFGNQKTSREGADTLPGQESLSSDLDASDSSLDSISAEGSGDLAASGDLDLGSQESEAELEAQLKLLSQSVDVKTIKGETGNPELQAKKIVFDLKAGPLDRLLRRSAMELGPLAKHIKSRKALSWIKALIKNVEGEKRKIADDARKLYLTVRMKELQTSDKVKKLQEQLKSQDTILKAKNNSLLRTREQLNEVTKNIEKIKLATVTGDAGLKQKLASSQKMLQVTHEENRNLVKKVQELNERLAAQQSKPEAQDKSLTEAYGALQTKYEKLYKQAEGYRKANRQLIERINEVKEKQKPVVESSADVGMQESLSNALKATAASQKENELLKERMLVMQKQEIKLKMKINKLIEELNAKNGNNSTGTSTGSSDDSKNGSSGTDAA